MASLRILQVCALDTTAETMLQPLLLALRDAGHDVGIACADTGASDKLAAQGFAMHDIPIERKIDWTSNWKTVRSIVHILKTGRYDAVHVHTPVAAALGRVAAKRAGTKHIVYTAHGFYFHEKMGRVTYQLTYSVEKWLARFATDYLLLQSGEDYELANRKRFKATKRLMHLGNGIDLTRFYPQTRQGNEAFTFLFIGRIVEEKGVLELLNAFENVVSQDPDVRLIIAGEMMESERDQTTKHRFLERLREIPNIEYRGFVEDVPRLLQQVDAFVLPSHREGVPRSIIEAMATAKPVIATNIRGCREEVIDGTTGYLVEVHDETQLAARMSDLVKHPQQASEMGRAGFERAMKHFNEADVIKRQLDLFSTM
ncbi:MULTISPECIES: glycosyltransferase family 4 protein [unclassified Exiguobacterium]|uniref:glycosyltransferase family 4 protein n=1 Tax=unclassified Exiguobacterium TaxID=2644629 RepID=UPI001BE6689F|nr:MULTISPECIES: glycosyltransferase family 4 protein [unclassified Exiguobacterium]